jgi:hypothetical protein
MKRRSLAKLSLQAQRLLTVGHDDLDDLNDQFGNLAAAGTRLRFRVKRYHGPVGLSPRPDEHGVAMPLAAGRAGTSLGDDTSFQAL